MSTDASEATLQPGMAERAADTATDMSRTIADVAAGLKVAVEELSAALAEANSGHPLPALRRVARQAPLTSLFVAFALGAMLTRRR